MPADRAARTQGKGDDARKARHPCRAQGDKEKGDTPYGATGSQALRRPYPQKRKDKTLSILAGKIRTILNVRVYTAIPDNKKSRVFSPLHFLI